jgi:hypothetical protein
MNTKGTCFRIGSPLNVLSKPQGQAEGHHRQRFVESFFERGDGARMVVAKPPREFDVPGASLAEIERSW